MVILDRFLGRLLATLNVLYFRPHLWREQASVRHFRILHLPGVLIRVFRTNIYLDRLLIRSHCFRVRFFLFRARLFFLTFRFFLNRLLFISRFIRPIGRFSLILLMVMSRTAVLIGGRRLLFHANRFVARDDSALHVRSFPKRFIRRIFIRNYRRFVNFLPFKDGKRIGFFLFIASRNVLFLRSLIAFLLLLACADFRRVVRLFRFHRYPLRTANDLNRLFVRLFRRSALLLPYLLFPPSFVHFRRPSALVILLRAVDKLNRVLLANAGRNLVSFPGRN